jgi:hypothetical protein
MRRFMETLTYHETSPTFRMKTRNAKNSEGCNKLMAIGREPKYGPSTVCIFVPVAHGLNIFVPTKKFNIL